MSSMKKILIPKENLFSIITQLGDDATWTNIYNHTINANGKRYASNDISFSIEYYQKEKLIEEKQKNKQTRVFSLTDNANNNYDDFLKNVAITKKQNLKILVDRLDNKKLFDKDGEFVGKLIFEDFTLFMVALEESWEFYSTLLHTREDSDYDGDSMTGLADTQAHDIFNSKITYVIKLTKGSIDDCCTKLKGGREENELMKIKNLLDNINWSLKSKSLL